MQVRRITKSNITLATGLVAQFAKEQEMEAKATTTGNYYFGKAENLDSTIDTNCTEYAGFTVGQKVYGDNMFTWNDYTEYIVLGFSPVLGIGNRFVDTPFRRVLVVSEYKGTMEGPHSQPARMFSAAPVEQVVPTCTYCKCRPQSRPNHGACSSARCQLNAMRASI